MRVAVDARVLGKPDPAGVTRYTDSLLRALAARDDGVSYLVFGVESLPAGLRDAPAVENAGVAPPVPSGPRAQAWEQVTLPRALRRYDVDLCHATAGFAPALADVPTVWTVHDLSPITHPEWFSRGYATLYRVLTPAVLRRVDGVITISEFSKTEIERVYPHVENVTAVHNGVTPIPADNVSPVDSLTPGEFFLFVGSLSPRKNVSRLLEAYERYRERADDPLPLVLAGAQKDVFAATDRPPVDGVRPLGFVPDAQRNWLYHNATALLFPSLYEGFGLPILEAMSADTPVLTSDRGAMAEVAGDAAVLVDPTDPEAVADGTTRLSSDPTLRTRLAAAGRDRVEEFTWAATATGTLAVYRGVTGAG
ncbi:MAG: glycosyltransferase family 1 protein [Haloarcula sp.]